MMVYDPKTGDVVLYGGTDGNGYYYQDMWTWDGTSWSPVTLSSNPVGPLAYGSMTYDAATGNIVLFGGGVYTTSTVYGDTWTLQLGALNMGTANVCSGGSTPSPCSQSAVLIFDLAANTTIGNVVYQSEDQAGTQFNLTIPNSGSNQCLFIEGATTGGATSCTVDITFTPTYPGLQKGAVVIVDSNGVPMEKMYVYGTGTGPQGALTPGTISTAAGDGTTAILNTPYGVAVDHTGTNIYIADRGDNKVLKMNLPSNTLTTVAGTGTSGYSGDGGKATSAELNHPTGVAVDAAGDMYIGDSANNRVRKIAVSAAPTMSFATTKVGSMSSDSPQTETFQNIGNGTLTFPVPVSGYNPGVTTNFTYDDTTYSTTACPQLSSSSPAVGTLASGASCTMSIDFTPTAPGTPATATETVNASTASAISVVSGS